jgi:hypothetical protein
MIGSSNYTTGLNGLEIGEEVIKNLRKTGIRRGCKSWLAYEESKRMLYAMTLSDRAYEQALSVLIDWIGI